jgi:hypothetical protein
VAIVSIAIASCSAFISVLLWLNARKGIRNQTYIKLLEDYSSPEMLAAVKALSKLKEASDRQGKPIYQLYREQNAIEEKLLQDSKPLEKASVLSASINNHRRLVSHFYYRLSAVIRNRVLPKRYIFRYWNTGGLHLIPQVIQVLHLDDDKELDELYSLSLKRSNIAIFMCFILFFLYIAASQLAVCWEIISPLLERNN